MPAQPDDVIIEKIKKLHALAERASTEAEAANAAGRVQELLLKYNLDLGEITLKEDPGMETEVGRGWRRIPAHASLLATACSNMFDVRFFFRGGRYSGWRFVFVGLKANVEAAGVTYEYLMESVEALVRGAKTENLIYGTEEFVAFRLGAAERIREITRERKAEMMASNPGYGELVHIGEALALSLFNAHTFKGSRGGSGGFMSFGSPAYSHGYTQGNRVDLAGARSNRMLK